MATFHHFASPLIGEEEIGRLRLIRPPTAHTDKEIPALMNLIMGCYSSVETIVIGHGRDTCSAEAALAFARHWETGGGSNKTGAEEVLTIVDWPEEAASWRRPATRFAEMNPDGWVVTGALMGWAQMSRRLQQSTHWDPGQTFGFASLADIRLIQAVGGQTLEGMRGVWPDGRAWLIVDGLMIDYSPAKNELRSF